MGANHMKQRWLVVGVIVLLIGISVVQVAAQTTLRSHSSSRGNWLYVGGSGPGNYSKIQDAIDNASAGDTIFVYDDSAPYLEQLFINTTLSLLGENRTTTIINSTVNEYYTVVRINADDTILTGFTIILNGGPGVEVSRDHARLSNLTIQSGVHGWSGTGVTLSTTSDTEITDTFIINAQIGILLTNATHATIAHNRIINPGLNGIIVCSSDNTIDTNTIMGNLDEYTQPVGIHLSGSRNRLSHNTIKAMVGDAASGISLSGATDNIIEGNDLHFTGFEQDHSEANLFINNTVNGKPFVFLVDRSDTVVDNAGQVILVNCTRMTIQDLTLSTTPYGVCLIGTSDSLVQRCSITSCGYGVYLEESTGNLIQNTSIKYCKWGLSLRKGGSNRIENNTIKDTTYDGLLISANDTQVSRNLIDTCSIGIAVDGCLHSIVSRNVVSHCMYGISLKLTAASMITQNTFVDNLLSAGFQNSPFNRWIGNYWGRPRLAPKIIPGAFVYIWHPDPIHYRVLSVPWMNIDVTPALEPYVIGG
jgi:parallel beta-helix repeat protein